jgi:(R,R)-butanediol dehydrogenase/meso-butanediol dehydrogenase/diacetyl reductase
MPTMKAVQVHGHLDVRLDDVDKPKPKPGWSLIKVAWTSICKSDVKEYQGPLYNAEMKVNSLTGVSVPFTLGHEFSGRVEETDGSLTTAKVGDRVVVDGMVRCGECWYCRHAEYNLCDRCAILGFDAHGSLAEYVLVPNYSIYPIPDNISDEAASVMEPLAVVVHAMRRSGIKAGDQVVVLGAGMIGLGCVAVARASGAGSVTVVEPMAARRERALAMGASAVIDPASGDAVRQLADLTDGYMADIAFDCVGYEESLNAAIHLARKGGRIGVIGVFTKPPAVAMNKIVLEDRELFGNLAYSEDFPRAISLVADGRVDAESFITYRTRLKDAIEDGIFRLMREPEKHTRIIVDCQAV